MVIVLLVLLFSLVHTYAYAAGPAVQAIRQEFAWNEGPGSFETVNLYPIGEVTDYIADRCEVLRYDAKGSGELIGPARDYVVWDQENQQWVPVYYCGDPAKGVVQRYLGVDGKAEGQVRRYDVAFYGQSADGLYERLEAFEPHIDITLANGWGLNISQHYDIWGNQTKMTSPSGKASYMYGDPHLLQVEGTQQQELAAIGEYAFYLGNYTLTFFCMKSNAGFSLVTDTDISGPDSYIVTIGRNSEVKTAGGAPQTVIQLATFTYHYVPVEGARFSSNPVYIAAESFASLTEARLYLNGDPYPMSGSGYLWNVTLSGLGPGTYSYYLWGTDGSREYTSSTRTFEISGSPTPIPTMTEWGLIILSLFLLGTGGYAMVRTRQQGKPLENQ